MKNTELKKIKDFIKGIGINFLENSKTKGFSIRPDYTDVDLYILFEEDNENTIMLMYSVEKGELPKESSRLSFVVSNYEEFINIFMPNLIVLAYLNYEELLPKITKNYTPAEYAIHAQGAYFLKVNKKEIEAELKKRKTLND